MAVHGPRVCAQQSNAIRVLFFPIFLFASGLVPTVKIIRRQNSKKKCLSVSGPTATRMRAVGCEALVVPSPWRVPAPQRQTMAPLRVRLIFMNPWVPPLRTWGWFDFCPGVNASNLALNSLVVEIPSLVRARRRVALTYISITSLVLLEGGR